MCRAVLNDKKERHEYDFHIEAAPPLGEVIYADCSWRDSSGPRIRMSHNTIASFVLTRVASLAVTDICFCSQVDKLFNPFTLLVGPCLVAYLVYKSTIPVADGGYHLPWWNIILFYLSDSSSPLLALPSPASRRLTGHGRSGHGMGDIQSNHRHYHSRTCE